MAQPTERETGATVFTELALRYQRELKTGGLVNAHRIMTIAADGDVEQAVANDRSVIGVNPLNESIASGVALDYGTLGIAWGPAVVVADVAINEGERLKSANAGRATPLVDSALAGGTIDSDATAGNFANQPAGDGVELISDNAGDVQSATLWYTRAALGDTVYKQTLALNGVTQVALTHTDVQLVLGAELSSVAIGTVTIREASGNLAITTITAGNTQAGVEDVDAANQRLGFNVAPTAVAGGASTKQVGLVGTQADGTEQLDSQALNGTTAVTMNQTFRTVTKVLVGDVATGTAVTFATGAEDDENICVGKALEAATAQGDLINALVLPR